MLSQTRILVYVLLVLFVLSTHGLAPMSLKPKSGSTTATTTGSSHRATASNRKQNKVMKLHQSSAAASASMNQDNSPEQKKNKSSAISAATFNLIKACVGSGVLALPAGLALMTDLPKA